MAGSTTITLRTYSRDEVRAAVRTVLRAGPVDGANPALLGRNERLRGVLSVTKTVNHLLSMAAPRAARKNSLYCVELTINYRAETLSGQSWGQQHSFFVDALDWLSSRFGGAENVALAVIQRDSAMPYLQILLVPIVSGTLLSAPLIMDSRARKALEKDFATEVDGLPPAAPAAVAHREVALPVREAPPSGRETLPVAPPRPARHLLVEIELAIAEVDVAKAGLQLSLLKLTQATGTLQGLLAGLTPAARSALKLALSDVAALP